MIRLRPSGADEVLIKRVRDWYEPGPGVFIAPQALFNPALLFTTGVNGTWYDPSDMTTLFRDAAGTTPVTAVEQPVGLMKDKSGRGNHAFNPSGNSANFPVLSAKYNLLTKTEQFEDAAWVKSAGTTVTANQAIAPDGNQAADLLVCAAGSDWVRQPITIPAVAVRYTYSAYVKANASNSFNITEAGATASSASFTLSGVGSVSVVNNGGSPAATISPVANGWYLCSFSYTSNGVQTTLFLNTYAPSAYIWGADLRVANDALNQPAYQRVNTATDYDTVGFKPYLNFNGTNQWLQTNSIDFTYGDKMFVCAGVRKLSDAAETILYELSSNLDTNNGAFNLFAPGGISVARDSAYVAVSKGTTKAFCGPAAASYPAPVTNIVTSADSISGPSIVARVNGTQVATSTATQGTGNYGNYPLYIGARAGSSLWFNGRLYQLVIADGGYQAYLLENDDFLLLEDGTSMLTEYGSNLALPTIQLVEAFVNNKTGAY